MGYFGEYIFGVLIIEYIWQNNWRIWEIVLVGKEIKGYGELDIVGGMLILVICLEMDYWTPEIIVLTKF